MSRQLPHALFLIAACAIATSASAHIGTDFSAHAEIGFIDGLLHPLTGLDHLAAMLAVGFWSALSARRLWTAPLAFAAMLLAGALLGLAGMALPAVEPMIAASLLVLGLLVALRTQHACRAGRGAGRRVCRFSRRRAWHGAGGRGEPLGAIGRHADRDRGCCMPPAWDWAGPCATPPGCRAWRAQAWRVLGVTLLARLA